jgi:tetratricopeptide (TPR) repeat protein
VGAAGLGILWCAVSLHAEAGRWQALVDAGNAALRKHQYVAAKNSFKHALREAQQSGYTDPRVAESYKLLGDVYFAQQRYDEAKRYYSRSEALHVASQNLYMAEQNLGAGAYVLTQQAAEMALQQIEAKVGRQDVLVTPCLITLGKADKSLLKLDEAEHVLGRAIQILDRPGEESADLASALGFLGTVHDAQGKHETAGPLLERALAIRQKILAPDDPKLAESCDDLAEHFRRMGQTADAEQFLKQAAAIREKGLFHFKEYVDKENGFRFEIPNAWSTSSFMGMHVPGALVAFMSPGSLSGVLVQRMPVAPGADPSAIFDAMGRAKETLGKGETIGEENVALSGLPARRVVATLLYGKTPLRDVETFLVTQSQV